MTHTITCTRGIESFPKHETASLLKPKPLLKLHGAKARDGLEVKMEPGNALQVIKDGPHGLIWTHADEVNGALLQFLASALVDEL